MLVRTVITSPLPFAAVLPVTPAIVTEAFVTSPCATAVVTTIGETPLPVALEITVVTGARASAALRTTNAGTGAPPTIHCGSRSSSTAAVTAASVAPVPLASPASVQFVTGFTNIPPEITTYLASADAVTETGTPVNDADAMGRTVAPAQPRAGSIHKFTHEVNERLHRA